MLLSMYLKHNSNISLERRMTADQARGASNVGGSMHMPTDSRPFDMASDEDLLASNFDRISQILPNSKQLPDFNGSQPGTPKPQNPKTPCNIISKS